MQTNVRVANTAFTISAAGVCGASLIAASVPLSAPGNTDARAGRYTVFVATTGNTEPMHVQPRCAWTDAISTVRTVPLALGLLSNAQAYGAAQSAAQLQTLLVLLCGQSGGFLLEGVAGSALQIIVSPASGIASATVVSGFVTIWRL